MNGARFDAFTVTLARTGSRRVLLRLLARAAAFGILGMFVDWAAPAEAGKTPSTSAGMGYLCNQPYVLCTSAPCQPSENDPSVFICRCLVQDGYSFGYTSCADRVPSGNSLVSTFSLQHVTSQSRSMTCSVGGSGGWWANCLDLPCTTDPTDPSQAVCQCVATQTNQYITFGGNCDLESCTSVIWSAATLDLPAIDQYSSAMSQLGQPVPALQSCPGS